MGDISNILRDSIKNATIFRSLFYSRLRKLKVDGNVLDLGSGERAHYHKFDNLKNLDIKTIGLEGDRFKPSIIHNLEEKLPLHKNSFEYVFAFNIFEHIYNHRQLMNECYRILRDQGKLFAVIPFLVRIHADPYDYFRYTKPSLNNLLSESGFKDIVIEPLGFGPLTAAYSQIQPVIPKYISILFIPIIIFCILLDKLVNKMAGKQSKRENYPIGYFITAKK